MRASDRAEPWQSVPLSILFAEGVLDRQSAHGASFGSALANRSSTIAFVNEVLAVLPEEAAYSFLLQAGRQSALGKILNLGRLRLKPRGDSGNNFVRGVSMETEAAGLQPDSDASIKLSSQADIDSLEVSLSVVLGTAVISVSDLFALSKGAAVEFSADPAGRIGLVLCGETVAFGRLVRQGARVGVMVTEIVSENEEQVGADNFGERPDEPFDKRY